MAMLTKSAPTPVGSVAGPPRKIAECRLTCGLQPEGGGCQSTAVEIGHEQPSAAKQRLKPAAAMQQYMGGASGCCWEEPPVESLQLTRLILAAAGRFLSTLSV